MTQEEFEKALKDYASKCIYDAIIAYLKCTADVMDKTGLEFMTADNLRQLALEMAVEGYQPQ